ncbi:hypothetical protein TNCV_4295471 [Trichonephila clavipes]|nr:hypothetical protein TNCV_4295471 [Trichonephila clavipes]
MLEICIAKFQNLHTYYRNEKKKLSSFRSGTGARYFVPKWEHFARLQFLDDTIKPLDSTSNLDYMELEINATPLNVSAEDLFERERMLRNLLPFHAGNLKVSSHKGQGCPPQHLERKKEKLPAVMKISIKVCKTAWGLYITKQKGKRNLSKENGETQQANINDENMQDLDNQQPSEKDIVQPGDISNAPTEKCLENVGFEFEKTLT